MSVPLDNVQGLIAHLYPCRLSRHLLFRFDADGGARNFLAALIPAITTSAALPPALPEFLLNVSITAGGLSVLVGGRPLDAMEAVFVEGPDAFRMGDIPGTPSDKTTWWERQASTPEIHCVVHIYANSKEALDTGSQMVRSAAASSAAVIELVPRRNGAVLDGQALGGRRLHFGYVDGISTVPVSWSDVDTNPGRLNFRHFILGYYRNDIQSFPRTDPAANYFRDSSYLVFRWIHQDVAGFEQFLTAQSAALLPSMDQAIGRELIAAKLMGRWRDGTPLVLSPEIPNAALITSEFFYSDDPTGARCPLSSHIRVVNPRDQSLDAAAAIEGVPKVIRRGMPYGPELQGITDDGVDRGLIGMFLCSNIRRQFYVLMKWINETSFSPQFAPHLARQDAIVGNRGAGRDSSFEFWSAGARSSIPKLPDFMHTKGTLFCLLPSVATLRRLALGEVW